MGHLRRRGGSEGDPAWTRQDILCGAARAGAGLFVLGGAGGLAERGLALARGVPAGGASSRSVERFRSRPDLRPPVVEIVHPARGTAPGYLFLAPSSGPGQRGVLILDDAGEVVWFRSTAPLTAMNFRAAVYRGEPVLTWWEGKSRRGTGVGECVIVDQGYREVARFHAGGGRPADLHEFLLTPRGTALVTSSELRTMNLTHLGGQRRWPVRGSVIQELDVPSARVLFEWRSLDHVALDESYQTIGPRFDYFHANSIDHDGDGNLLVSARNTWTVYKVSRESGGVLWRLGGKRSDFAMGEGTSFAWQHDARSHDGGRVISVFDNGSAPEVEQQSSALFIALDTTRMRATLERRYVHDPPLQARKTGSVQLLRNGDVLVGWGTEPYVTELARDGSVRFDARLPPGGQSYRAYRFPWVGRPVAPPALTAATTGGRTALYASWNGATEVAAWRLLAGTRRTALRSVATVPRRGFETELPIGGSTRQAAVVALDQAGRPVGRSVTVAL
jgi:Arylsulfotransferase (ASST)